VTIKTKNPPVGGFFYAFMDLDEPIAFSVVKISWGNSAKQKGAKPLNPQTPAHDRLLCMKPIFCLIKYDRIRTVHHF